MWSALAAVVACKLVKFKSNVMAAVLALWLIIMQFTMYERLSRTGTNADLSPASQTKNISEKRTYYIVCDSAST
jgi:hypothetical protein